MKQKQKYVNFYRRALQKACLYNMELDASLKLIVKDALRPAACITNMFDTQDEDMSYNRLKLAGAFNGAKLEIIVAACDSPDSAFCDETYENYFSNEKISLDDKREAMCNMQHIRAVNTQDLLLHSLRGRYVWVLVCITPGEDALRYIDGISLEFPKESFVRYFPEIYQNNDFFDRYISVFQSMLLDIEQEVDNIPQMLDYQSAPPQQVAELASWLGIENKTGLFNDEQLRSLIEGIDLYQGKKGTRGALEAVIELVCKIRPRIVEYFLWNKCAAPAANRKLYEQLYASDANQFCVILNLTKENGALPIAKDELERLIDEYSIIGSTHRLVLLNKCSHIDTHCYLDVNSCLSMPEKANAAGMTLGGYITAG
ncbi:MAG: phage tail protein [Oscillospiraceae bacterium]